MADEAVRSAASADEGPTSEHQRFLTDVRNEVLPRLRADLDAARNELDTVLAEADPIDLLALAGFMYLRVDPNTYRESQDDRGSAHIEYLALQVLPFCADEPRSVAPGVAARQASKAVLLVREMFKAQSMLIVTSPTEAPERIQDPATQAQVQARLQSLSVRGSGYPEHLRAVLAGTLGAFDADCVRLIGFSAGEALEAATTMVRVVNDRLVPQMHAARCHEQDLLAALPRQRRKRSRPSPGVNDNGRRFLQELPTQRRKDYARVCTSISHRPYSGRDRCPVRWSA